MQGTLLKAILDVGPAAKVPKHGSDAKSPRSRPMQLTGQLRKRNELLNVREGSLSMSQVSLLWAHVPSTPVWILSFAKEAKGCRVG
jgi:hypothetical protein